MERNRTVFLNGRRMRTREAAIAYIKRKLDLPQGCGNNLDALYDALTGQGSPLYVRLYNTKKLLAAQPEYGARLIAMLKDAAKACEPQGTFEIRQGLFS